MIAIIINIILVAILDGNVRPDAREHVLEPAAAERHEDPDNSFVLV